MYTSGNTSTTLVMLGTEATITQLEPDHFRLGEQRLRTIEEIDPALRIFETSLVYLGVTLTFAGLFIAMGTVLGRIKLPIAVVCLRRTLSKPT